MPLISELVQELKRRSAEVGQVDIVSKTGATVCTISSGVGSPEGVVSGLMGSVYLNQSGGVPTTIYVKTSAGAAAVAATGTLTGTTIAVNDTVTIGSTVYTFKSPVTTAYHVLVGATDSDSLDNLIAAITAGAGAGTAYGTGTLVHPTVTAAAGAGDTMDATALTAGTAGNSIATTATLTAGGWGAATLTGGVAANLSTGWTAK
jgi:hypothetical protein